MLHIYLGKKIIGQFDFIERYLCHHFKQSHIFQPYHPSQSPSIVCFPGHLDPSTVILILYCTPKFYSIYYNYLLKLWLQWWLQLPFVNQCNAHLSITLIYKRFTNHIRYEFMYPWIIATQLLIRLHFKCRSSFIHILACYRIPIPSQLLWGWFPLQLIQIVVFTIPVALLFIFSTVFRTTRTPLYTQKHLWIMQLLTYQLESSKSVQQFQTILPLHTKNRFYLFN